MRPGARDMSKLSMSNCDVYSLLKMVTWERSESISQEGVVVVKGVQIPERQLWER